MNNVALQSQNMASNLFTKFIIKLEEPDNLILKFFRQSSCNLTVETYFTYFMSVLCH